MMGLEPGQGVWVMAPGRLSEVPLCSGEVPPSPAGGSLGRHRPVSSPPFNRAACVQCAWFSRNRAELKCV